MLIISDLDGVGAEMDTNLRRRWLIEHSHLNLPESFMTWNWHKDISADHTKAFNALLDSPGFFGELEEIEGWAKAINQMLKDGHDVLVATSPWESNPTGWQDKVDWVARIAGKKWLNRIILTSDKTIIDADYLIDDKPGIHGRRPEPFWTQVFYTQPYNQNEPGYRIDNWTDGSWKDVLYGLPDFLR